jgi:hypothetical protein
MEKAIKKKCDKCNKKRRYLRIYKDRMLCYRCWIKNFNLIPMYTYQNQIDKLK